MALREKEKVAWLLGSMAWLVDSKPCWGWWGTSRWPTFVGVEVWNESVIIGPLGFRSVSGVGVKDYFFLSPNSSRAFSKRVNKMHVHWQCEKWQTHQTQQLQTGCNVLFEPTRISCLTPKRNWSSGILPKWFESWGLESTGNDPQG